MQTSLLFFCLTGYAYGNIGQIADGLSLMAKNTPRSINKPKQFTGLINHYLETHLNGYGCWCYFGLDDNVTSGKGKTVDSFDEHCKALQLGYRCAMEDAEAAGTTCVPWEVGYLSVVGSNLELDKPRYERCKIINPTSLCAAQACAVESIFIENMFQSICTEAAQDEFQHKLGYQADSSCTMEHLTPAAIFPSGGKQCCGEYPSRVPVRITPGKRECCGATTFNPVLFECCDAETSKVDISCS